MTAIGRAASLVFACDGEQFILRLVAELALPETGGPLRQHRRVARSNPTLNVSMTPA